MRSSTSTTSGTTAMTLSSSARARAACSRAIPSFRWDRRSSSFATAASADALSRVTGTILRRVWASPGNEKTVIRSGAGIYYVRDISNAVFDIVRNIPFTIRQNEVANSLTPNLSWAQPFTQTGAPTFILANQFGEPSSYVAQWSFGIQREITKSSSLEITYLGSAGVHLRRLQVYNSAPPGPGATNSRRPFTYLNGNIQTMTAPSHSSYDALHLRFQHRLHNGFTLLSSYAYGKSIDNGSGVRTTDGDALRPSDNYNLRAERGRSAFDFRQRWTNSFLYELPVGKGKKWLNQGGVAN